MKAYLQNFFSTVNPAVFAVSGFVVIAFLVFGVTMPETASAAFDALHGFITEYLGWSYLVAVTGFLGFLIWLAFSRYGGIRLGMPDDRPEFGFLAWFAMLFSAGMGLSLIHI